MPSGMTCPEAAESIVALTFTLLSFLDCFPHSAVRHARRPSVFVSFLLITSCHCSCSLSSNKHHACNSSSLSTVSPHQRHTSSCFRHLDTMLQCVLLRHMSSMSCCPPLPPFCSLASFLAVAFLPRNLSSKMRILATFAPETGFSRRWTSSGCRRVAPRL